MKLHPVDGTVIGQRKKVGIAHGHSWPSEEVISSRTIVMGHSHFRYEMRDRFGGRNKEAVWLFASYDIADLLKKAGHPATEEGRGQADRDAALQQPRGRAGDQRQGRLRLWPILSSGSVDVADADIFLLDGTRVG